MPKEVFCGTITEAGTTISQAYTPPFTISAEAINQIARISALVERYAIRMEQKDARKLRKANRIRTIHSSLAIEGNQLSEEQVCDVIEGRNVMAPLREIQEVNNALHTYELYPKLNPMSWADMLKAHGVMMQALSEEAGHWRRGGVGVYDGNRIIHMAPPADLVPLHMEALFDWLQRSQDHWLIRSCVFHYELEFIHPFNDGNGRMGRLWQSLILGKWNPIFEHLPVENMVYSNQQAYYDAIEASTREGQCGPFIDFMLGEIATTQEQRRSEPVQQPAKLPNKHTQLTERESLVYSLIQSDPTLSAEAMGSHLNLSSRQVRTLLARLRTQGLIEREGSNKKGRWLLKDAGC